MFFSFFLNASPTPLISPVSPLKYKENHALSYKAQWKHHIELVYLQSLTVASNYVKVIVRKKWINKNVQIFGC